MAEALKLNVGSGQRRFEGPDWINADIACRPPDQIPDLMADARKMPLPDGCASLVLLNQVYEHFHLSEGRPVLKEAYRLLKPGGRMVLTVPNLRALVQRWMARQINDYIFCVNLHGAWQGLPGDDHHWSWTPETLKKEVREVADWGGVYPYSWCDEGVPHDWWILGVEAVK